MTDMQARWMDEAPFLPALNAILADMGRRYADAGTAIASDDFRARMDAVADSTPGVADWLAQMP